MGDGGWGEDEGDEVGEVGGVEGGDVVGGHEEGGVHCVVVF